MPDHLKLVPKSEPTPKEKVRNRIKAHSRPDGMLQCPECGGRAVCKVENGVIVKNGRKQRGALIVENVCDICRQLKNRLVTMRTGLERPTRAK